VITNWNLESLVLSKKPIGTFGAPNGAGYRNLGGNIPFSAPVSQYNLELGAVPIDTAVERAEAPMDFDWVRNTSFKDLKMLI
jgi:hypothetical protein